MNLVNELSLIYNADIRNFTNDSVLLNYTMCPPAATCGKSDRARIGTWEPVWQFLHG